MKKTTLLILVLSLLLISCDDDDNDGYVSEGCVAAANNMQSCDLYTDGTVNCAMDYETPKDSCYAFCVAEASCDDLEAFYCSFGESNELTDSFGGCDTLSESYACGDGTEIEGYYVCDGEEDCDNGADEANCARFECTEFGSVPQSWVCDGEQDCDDGSDEAGCGEIAELSCPVK